MAAAWCHLTRSPCTTSLLPLWVFSFPARQHLRFSNSQPVSAPIYYSFSRASLTNISRFLGMTKGKNAANYIFWLHELVPTVQESPSNKDNGPKSGGPLALDSVRFSYPLRPEAAVLKGVDLEVSLYLITNVTALAYINRINRFKRVSSWPLWALQGVVNLQ